MSLYNQPKNEITSNLKKANLNNKLFSVSQGELCNSIGVPDNPNASRTVAEQKQFLINLQPCIEKLLMRLYNDSTAFKEFKEICHFTNNTSIMLEMLQLPFESNELNQLFFDSIKLVNFYSLWFAIYHCIHYGVVGDFETPAMIAVQKESYLLYNLFMKHSWFTECNFPILPPLANKTPGSLSTYFNELNPEQQRTRPYAILQEIGTKLIDGPISSSEPTKIQFFLLIRLFEQFFGRSSSLINIKSMWNRWGRAYFKVPFSGFDEGGFINNFPQILNAYKRERV